MITEVLARCTHTEPLFALTLGDPAGIGPEISIKACKNRKFLDTTLIVGDADIVREEAKKQSFPVNINAVDAEDGFKKGELNVLHCGQITPDMYVKGKSQAVCGMAAYTYIQRAIESALAGRVDGVITNPISKESLSLAGIPYPGHTEIFADKTQTTEFSMLFLLNNIGVAHVTTHCSLVHAISLVTRTKVLSTIILLNDALKQLGVASPRIAVSGLNPHAGENGLFGDEEINHIIPAVGEAQRQGIVASGPYPPDTVFMRAFKGEFDGVVSMLHDHGFVALKSMDFEQGVNITIGLPIIRTSVGHGTAFDIAGKGIASERSLYCAHDAAMRLYCCRKQFKE